MSRACIGAALNRRILFEPKQLPISSLPQDNARRRNHNYNTIQYNTITTIKSIQDNTIQYDTIQYNTINTLQYNTIQSIQYKTRQYNTEPNTTSATRCGQCLFPKSPTRIKESKVLNPRYRLRNLWLPFRTKCAMLSGFTNTNWNRLRAFAKTHSTRMPATVLMTPGRVNTHGRQTRRPTETQHPHRHQY